jgi:GT2 family glycosyltransferase
MRLVGRATTSHGTRTGDRPAPDGGNAAFGRAPRLRAVVLNYNGAPYTLACASALVCQLHTPLDLVVIDNGSCDSDFAALRSGIAQGAVLIRSERNVGFAGGMNVGARTAAAPRPDYILFLNNDLLFPDGRMVGALISAVERSPKRVAASPLVAAADVGLPVEAQVQVRRVPGYWTLLVVHSWWLRRLPGLCWLFDRFVYADQRPYGAGTDYECESINGSCFLVRSSFLEEIGYLDEGTFLFLEELVLGKQILDRGLTAVLTTTTHVVHAQGQATGHGGDRVRLAMLIEMVRSEIYYCRRYLHSGRAAIALLLLVRALDIATKVITQPFVRATRGLVGRHGGPHQ